MLSTEPAARDSHAAVRPFFVSALLGCGLLIGGFVLTTVLGDRENHDAMRAELSAVRAAVEQETQSIGTRLRAFAAITPLIAPPGAFLPVSGPFHALYLMDLSAARVRAETRDAIRDTLDGALRETDTTPDGLRGALEPPSEPLHEGGMRNALVRLQSKAAIAVSVPVGAGRASTRPMIELVALQPVDDAMLARLAQHASTARLDLAHVAPTTRDVAALRLTDDDVLVWMPKRPGDSLFRTASAILTLSGVLYAVAILFLGWRVTRRLSDGEARARADASHDLLTGLANRTAFSRALQREVERTTNNKDRCFALIYLDVDRFKEVNDTYGHAAGDLVITEAARRIASTVRAGSQVARIGGDEFAILLSDVRDPNECAELARRILTLFAEPIEIGGGTAQVSISIGIALCPNDAQTIDTIINSTDLALYRAKNEGRNRFCFFEHRMGEQLRLRKAVEDDLREAIGTDQLVMEFQPVVSLDGARMLGVEALVRWHHPTKGIIPPASFITMAEECGLILPLGEWVMRRALTDARRWPRLRVAVNVSGIQFRQKNFVQTVQRLLDETGVDPTQLELELTESVLLADADQAEDAMIDLRAMGVRLALDDFGTGYSSLIYLRRFAFDKIKIDRSFLESTESTGESAIIVHSIVHLGRALGLTVTAEGVETQEQHRFMQALGCHELQGYLFSPPVPAAEIDRRLGLTKSEQRSVA